MSLTSEEHDIEDIRLPPPLTLPPPSPPPSSSPLPPPLPLPSHHHHQHHLTKFKVEIQQTDEIIVQDALNETVVNVKRQLNKLLSSHICDFGFGKFNFKVLAISALICMNAAFGMLSIGFILPTAACDFKMTTEDKGHLTISTMLGMLSGSYFWGCLADTKGRRISLLACVFLHGGSEFLASLIPFYWGFVLIKFISGLAICGQLTMLYTYLAEFQPIKKRDLFLSWMETAWVMGMVIVSCSLGYGPVKLKI
ncbi:synaptic vesicle glycoprotein 2C-like isoform X2 [Vespula squamosa]|uniref:Synaptic vesicle glycoprotein 2C-like isoform X2 n=1 Tax=Vespula squamosa TaxID=30214 RepID=A0ABD2B9N5_VESSQ